MEAFNNLIDCGPWFQTLFIYIYINYLNSYSIDSRTKAVVKTGAGPKSRLKEPKIVEPSILGALLPYTILSLEVKSLFHLLRRANPY